MDKKKKFGLKQLLALILTVTAALSLFIFAACGDTTGSSSSSSSASDSSEEAESSITDYQTISNGDFEFNVDEDDTLPKASGINWTRSNASDGKTSALSSNKSSGIIDTADEAYNAIAETNGFPKLDGSEEYFNPRTPAYYGLVENSYVYDENKDNTDKLPTSGSKILMIHNSSAEESRGTAQKFSSSTTFTVDDGYYGKVTLWVMTKDLKTRIDTTDFGAYVSVINTISSVRSPFIIKNINTEGQWTKVTLFLEPSDYASSSFRIVLGLGFGTRELMAEYVEGFAYFDNVHYEQITAKEFATQTAADIDGTCSLFKAETDGTFSDKTAEELKLSVPKKTIINNGDKSDNYDNTKTFTTYNYIFSHATTATDLLTYIDSMCSKVNTDVLNHLNCGANAASSYYGKDTLDALKADASFGSLFSDINSIYPSTSSYYYLVNTEPSSTTLVTEPIRVADGDYLHLTFLALIKPLQQSQTALTVNVMDCGTDGSFDSDTRVAASTDLDTIDYENENTENWAKFNIYLNNTIGDGADRYFRLEFVFGPSAVVDEYYSLAKGFALISEVQVTQMSEIENSIANTSATNTAVMSLGKDLPNGSIEDEADDSYSFTPAAGDNVNLENTNSKYVVNYTGVVGDHTMVGGEKTAYTQAETISGVINSEYLNNYSFLDASEISAISSLSKIGENKFLQPLIIKNTSATTYGYISSSSTIAANSTVLVSVKVKVLGNASAYVYIGQADPLSGFGVLDIKAQKYTVDSDGKPTVTDNEFFFTQQLYQKITASDCNEIGGWITVNFILTSGENSIPYRVELWNGTRDGKETSEGLVIFDNYQATSSPNVSQLINQIETDYGAPTSTNKYTRIPTTVKYLDDSNNEAARYESYEETTIFTEYETAKTIIASYATLDVTSERDETAATDDSSSESSSTTPVNGTTDWTLQIISIIVAAVLVLVLIVIFVRSILKKARKSKAAPTEFYNRSSRERAHEQIKLKKQKQSQSPAKKQPVEKAQEPQAEAKAPQYSIDNSQEEAVEEEAVPEYDYDNPENNLPK